MFQSKARADHSSDIQKSKHRKRVSRSWSDMTDELTRKAEINNFHILELHVSDFLDGFFKKPSVKKSLSGWVRGRADGR